MKFELSQLFGFSVLYLMVLFLVAYAAERRAIPEWIAKHPVTYVLSLGVYTTTWSYYGSVGFAQSQGYNFLTIYLGVTVAFVLTPVLLTPIFRITREYQLTSLADVFAFRYRSQLAGVLVTLFMLAGTLPYIALQIRAVSQSLTALTDQEVPGGFGFWFCVTITLFAILFGARHISPREKHEGLVVAIAFESLVKLLAILGVAVFALFYVFDGVSGLNSWLDQHPDAVNNLYAPVRDGPWTTYLLLSFAAAFLLPRQFHMTFAENDGNRNLPMASWAFPLFLLAFNLAIPIVLWSGQALQLGGPADYFLLGITQHSESRWLSVFAFLGGISAASAMMIVTSLALSHMCLNHLLLPASYPDPKLDLYRWLLWSRRLLIACIIGAGYIFYLILENNEGLVQLGLISFVAVAQFLPGLVGLLFWQRATKSGFVAGLAAGAAIWAYTLLIPLFTDAGLMSQHAALPYLMEASGLDKWSFSTFWSLTVNALLFVVFSILTRQPREEADAARACARGSPVLLRERVKFATPAKLIEQLSLIIGTDAAQREVENALHDLRMTAEETRSAELQRLRDRIERNLSGLMGPSLARIIIDKRVQMDSLTRSAFGNSIRYIEDRLEESRTQLRGIVAQMDSLRRYHRQVLMELPLGACALGAGREIVLWNLAMEILSGVHRDQAVGTTIDQLPPPWNWVISEFAVSGDQHQHKRKIRFGGKSHWLNLHKAAIEQPFSDIDPAVQELPIPGDDGSGMVILVEDLTELQVLEAELTHSERLASIGRLAAGVAHEIGNPVTGIACLAQNLKYETNPEAAENTAAQILEQTQRITDIVQTLVSFSHGGSVIGDQTDDYSLFDCAEEAARLVRLTHSGKQVVCDNRMDAGLKINGNRQRMIQVFVNLLTNACDASEPGSTVRIEARVEGEQIHTTISDQGHGIPEEMLEKVFEPFYTTKEPGEGTGLGLPMVYSIIQDHGGQISIESTGEGTTVHIRLPLAEPTHQSQAESA